MKVVVLAGGISTERDVSLISGKMIYQAMKRLGHQAVLLDVFLGKIDQFLNEIPLDKIVLETDSPYLAPVPHRGKRNESSYLDLVVGKLVNIYNKDFPEIDRITTENALKMFSK